MASNAKKTKCKRGMRKTRAGRARKNRQGRKSTPSDAELFAGCGVPGQPAPGLGD